MHKWAVSQPCKRIPGYKTIGPAQAAAAERQKEGRWVGGRRMEHTKVTQERKTVTHRPVYSCWSGAHAGSESVGGGE